MKPSRAIALLFGVVLMVFDQPSAVFSAPRGKAPHPGASHVAGEVLVKFRSSHSGAQKVSTVALRNHSIIAELNPRGWVHVRTAAGQAMSDALAAYQNDPNVEYVQPNYIYRVSAVPNDSQYGQLWGLRNTGQSVNGFAGTPGADINIEKAWDHITDCRSVVVAVLDSGINYNHEELAANMWNGGPSFPFHGVDFVDNDSDPMDAHGHGTHVAGSLAARGNNATGVAGVCWRATIMAVRVMNAAGVGTTANIIQGIDFAVTNGAKVINMSLGGPGGGLAYSEAIGRAQADDVVVVVASGNDTKNVDFPGGADFPCSFINANLLCVAALDQNYGLASFSNFGLLSVDVGAPGMNILSSRGVQTTTITDDFNSLGTLDWNTSGGWAYRPLSVSGIPVDVLANPTTFPAGTYANSADNRVYKSFNTNGKVHVTLEFFVQHALEPGDVLNVNYGTSGGDPFAGGTSVDQLTGNTPGVPPGVDGPFSYEIPLCVSATCTIGFQLMTNASGTNQGVGILLFSLALVEAINNTYTTSNGTSMASPIVAGLATMLRAYNPQFTYVDVVNAIRNGGRSVAALNGKTTTGKAIDVMGSLAYINPPTGVAASVIR